MTTTPMDTDVMETTVTANLAVWKLPAPSSFETLTLYVKEINYKLANLECHDHNMK